MVKEATSFRIDPGNLEKLEALAERDGVTLTKLVEDAVNEFLEKRDLGDPENLMVRKMLRGSENIDKMKKQIESVTRGVMNLAKNRGKISFELLTKPKVCIKGETCEWVIRKSKKDDVVVECLIQLNMGAGRKDYTVGYSTADGFHGNENVIKVHRGLRVLLVELMKDPVIREMCQPFLDAADYEF